MRSFPSSSRRHAVAVLAACSVALGLLSAPAAFADQNGRPRTPASAEESPAEAKRNDKELQAKQLRLQREMAEVHGDLESSSAQLIAAQAALSMARSQLASAQEHLAKTRGELAAAEALDRQMQAELEAAVARLAEAREDLEQSRADIAEREEELGQIVVSNYQTGDPALMGLSMVLTTQDPGELTGQLNSVQNIIDKEAVALAQLEASKVLLTVQEQQVAEAKAEVARQRREAAENLVRKKKLERRAVAAEQQVANLVSLRANAEQEAANARAADLATLQSLEAEQERVAEILRQRAEEARARAAAAAAAAAMAGSDSGPIRSNGYLDFPVDGSITSPYGWRRHPIFGYKSLHDGIDFGAGCGTPIYATARGVVVARYSATAWGRRVIVDHGWVKGVGLATISNHLSSWAVDVGDRVKRGQIIGFVGNSGWSTGCHLHFTVMENGVAVNPLRWL